MLKLLDCHVKLLKLFAERDRTEKWCHITALMGLKLSKALSLRFLITKTMTSLAIDPSSKSNTFYMREKKNFILSFDLSCNFELNFSTATLSRSYANFFLFTLYSAMQPRNYFTWCFHFCLALFSLRVFFFVSLAEALDSAMKFQFSLRFDYIVNYFHGEVNFTMLDLHFAKIWISNRQFAIFPADCLHNYCLRQGGKNFSKSIEIDFWIGLSDGTRESRTKYKSFIYKKKKRFYLLLFLSYFYL